MKITTLERLIKKTTIPYGDLINRAIKGGLIVSGLASSILKIRDERNRTMILYFENPEVYINNKENGLIKTEYNY